ncbi:MAG: hypothetical protein K2M60_01070 [Lachnospiraceae bacterium]|nr:hypothetical protein [Lachnospiraceae bacterium]
MKNYIEFIKDMPKLSDFKFWFIWTSNGLTVIDCATWENKGLISQCMDDEVSINFDMFKRRPEYLVGKESQFVPSKESENFLKFKLEYQLKLLGCSLLRNEVKVTSFEELCDVDQVVEHFSRCIEWLNSTDFFVAPASCQYHGSFASGLLYHSLDVCNHILSLWRSNIFRNDVNDIPLHSAILCALVHDWCKIGMYEKYMKNIKNDKGKWQQVPSFKHVISMPFVFGHGVSSMYLAGKFFKLNPEEAAAIRWHMGRWQVGECEYGELQQANQRYPLVYMLQFADQLSCTDYACERE